MSAISNEERVFELYSFLPTELRMMVVDEMQPDDRCRFRRCSKLSSKEATSSMKFIYSLEMHDRLENFIDRNTGRQKHVMIRVTFNNMKLNRANPFGFELHFEEVGGKNVVRCTRIISSQEFWRTELCLGNATLTDFATVYFKNLLNTYRNTIKELCIFLDIPSMYNFDEGINIMNNLEHVSIGFEISMLEFLSKLRRPIKTLAYGGFEPIPSCQKYNQIYQVSECLDMRDLRLNYQEFMKLSASDISIHIGDWTIEDFSNFVKSWRKGEIRDSLSNCHWDLRDSSFNVEQLFEPLELVESDVEEVPWKSIIKRKDGKCAELFYETFRNAILFEIPSDD